jgi:hypothetical protein
MICSVETLKYNISYGYNFYFLKIKYTAKIRKAKPIRWFILNVSVLNKTRVNNVNIVNVITS